MSPPALIELALGDDRRIYLIFQGKACPELHLEIRGKAVWATRCPDDGNLFLEGSPENYADVKICLDPPEETLAFQMSAEMVEVMCAATTCAFGEVGEYEGGDYGPGFTYDGITFAHDQGLGVSSECTTSFDQGTEWAQVAVWINRPSHRDYWRYCDEEDPQAKAPGADDPHDSLYDAEAADDMEMDDDGAAQNQTSGGGDELATRMKTLRLKGR